MGASVCIIIQTQKAFHTILSEVKRNRANYTLFRNMKVKCTSNLANKCFPNLIMNQLLFNYFHTLAEIEWSGRHIWWQNSLLKNVSDLHARARARVSSYQKFFEHSCQQICWERTMNYKVKEAPANVDMFSNESDKNLVPQYWFIYTEELPKLSW